MFVFYFQIHSMQNIYMYREYEQNKWENEILLAMRFWCIQSRPKPDSMEISFSIITNSEFDCVCPICKHFCHFINTDAVDCRITNIFHPANLIYFAYLIWNGRINASKKIQSHVKLYVKWKLSHTRKRGRFNIHLIAGSEKRSCFFHRIII